MYLKELFQTVKAKNTIYLITVVGIFAAIFYSAWLVSYFINPAVFLHATISELVVPGQPHRQLFVWTDVITFGLILSAVGLVWQKTLRRWAKIVLILYALFGALLLLSSTLLSLDCASSARVCGTDKYEISHVVLSVVASIIITAAIVVLEIKIKDKKIKKVLLVTVITTTLLSLLAMVLSTFNHSGWAWYMLWLQKLILLLSAVLLAAIPPLTAMFGKTD